MTLQIRGGFVLSLSDDFVSRLEAAADDEMCIAEQKFGIRLSEEDRKRVRYHSVRQLESRVSRFSGYSWQVGDAVIQLKITEFVARKKVIHLPSDALEDNAYELTRIRDGMGIATDADEDTVAVGELAHFLEALIERWLRTGVFYGVGSYR